MSEFTRSMSWLRGALDVVDPQLPNALETGAGVLPVIDAARSGHHEARGYAFEHVITGPAAAQDVFVGTSGERALTYWDGLVSQAWHMFLWIAAVQTGGAACTVRVGTMHNNPTLGGVPELGASNVGADGVATHLNLFGTNKPLWLAPGAVVRLRLLTVVIAGGVLSWQVRGYMVPSEVPVDPQ